VTFHRVEPNGHYRALRMLSAEGRWELGLSPYQEGIRLRMGIVGRPPSVLDFCLGKNPSLLSPALLAVMQRLTSVSEEACVREIDEQFPWAGTRPDLSRHLEALLESAGLAQHP
jgi:hypothetical protein